MVDEVEFDVMDIEEMEGFSGGWTFEEIRQIVDDIQYLKENVGLDDEWAMEVFNRTMDIKDNPEVFLTLDEFIEECEKRGLVKDVDA